MLPTAVNISYNGHITYEEIRRKIQAATEAEYDPGQEMETKVLCPRLTVFWFRNDNSTGQNKRKKKR